MTGALLGTKLYVPQLRRGSVGRPRLMRRMEAGADARLTLMSAPAGFGKTTVLAEWLHEGGAADRSVAWLSLDATDNDTELMVNPVTLAEVLVGPTRNGREDQVLTDKRWRDRETRDAEASKQKHKAQRIVLIGMPLVPI